MHLVLAMLMITVTGCESATWRETGADSARAPAPRASIDAGVAPEAARGASAVPDASVVDAPNTPEAAPDAGAAVPDASAADAKTTPEAEPDASAAVADASVADVPTMPQAAPDASAAPDSSVADAPTTPDAWIFTEDLANARGLGGVPLTGSATTSYGVLYRGQTLDLSAAGCEEFASLRIRTVVDLRDEIERRFWRHADCVRDSATILIAPLGSSEEYLGYISTQRGIDSIAATFAVLGDPEAYPVYIHCTYGRDRTGTMSALILSALGASRAAIMDEYNRSSETVGSSPEELESVLDEVDAAGGIEAFLERAGVTSDQLETLRAVATAGST